MTSRFKKWLIGKWHRQTAVDLARAYATTFRSPHGQMVLQHWLDEVYCRVCLSNDPIALAIHNARRSFVQEILEAIDTGESPGKYDLHVEETNYDRVA